VDDFGDELGKFGQSDAMHYDGDDCMWGLATGDFSYNTRPKMGSISAGLASQNVTATRAMIVFIYTAR
jgi:hypothetical protein